MELHCPRTLTRSVARLQRCVPMWDHAPVRCQCKVMMMSDSDRRSKYKIIVKIDIPRRLHSSSYFLSFGATLSLLLHRLPFHTTVQTFLVTTVLTTVPLLLVYDAILFFSARVRQVLSHSSLEEALAPLATERKKKTRRVNKIWSQLFLHSFAYD